MTDISRARLYQWGLHSSSTSFSAVASTFVAAEVEEAGFDDFEKERVERNLHRGDNDEYAEIIGPDALDEFSLALPMRGVATNDGGALTALTETDFGHPLESLMGATATAKSGAADAIQSDTGSSGTIVVAGTAFANGGGVLFMDGNDEYVAREVVSGGGSTTLVLDRDHTDGAPRSDAIPYGSIYYTHAPNTPSHKPLCVRVKGSNFERTALGCIGDASFEVRPKLPLMFRSSWLPNDYQDTTVGPSFSAPTVGEYIMGVNSRLWLGADADAVMVKEATLHLGHTRVPRETITGPNGINGYAITRKQPRIECTFVMGALGLTFGEVPDSSGNFSVNKIQGLTNSSGSATVAGDIASTFDIGLQVGARPGGTMYVRMPAATLRGRIIKENGLEMVRCVLTATRASSGSAMRIHFF